jgi:hypothetical protein
MGEVTEARLTDEFLCALVKSDDWPQAQMASELLALRSKPNTDPSKRLHCNCPSCVCLLDVVEDEHG